MSESLTLRVSFEPPWWTPLWMFWVAMLYLIGIRWDLRPFIRRHFLAEPVA